MTVSCYSLLPNLQSWDTGSQTVTEFTLEFGRGCAWIQLWVELQSERFA